MCNISIIIDPTFVTACFSLFSLRKALMTTGFFCSILWMSLILTGNSISLKSSYLSKSLSAFVILAAWWFAGCKYLPKHHLKHLLPSIFWILIKPFFGWFNSFGILVQLLPAKGLHFEILILWCINNSTWTLVIPEIFVFLI